jgi:hypothetical protein
MLADSIPFKRCSKLSLRNLPMGDLPIVGLKSFLGVLPVRCEFLLLVLMTRDRSAVKERMQQISQARSARGMQKRRTLITQAKIAAMAY